MDYLEDNSYNSTVVKYDWSFGFASIFIFAGVLGNVLVCLAVFFERRLQNVTNMFLVSLAMADLLVSVVVMPFGATSGFLGYWPFNSTWCNFYATCDVLACSSSILHMCFISISRYVGIRSPIKARRAGLNTSRRIVGIKIALVWLLAGLISSPLTVLGLADPSNIMQGPHCSINNRAFFVFGSMAAFYIPMLIMVTSYILTIRLLRQKAQSQLDGVGHLSRTVGQPSRKISGFRNRRGTELNSSHERQKEEIYWVALKKSQGTQTPISISKEIQLLKLRTVVGMTSSSVVKATNTSTKKLIPQQGSIMRRKGNPEPHVTTAVALANEQKASKVLGIVFFTFVICWAPFFVLNIVMAACPDCPLSEHIIALCLWLGYVSSTINPIIYTIFNRSFKRAFVRLLLCHCFRQRQFSSGSTSSAGSSFAITATRLRRQGTVSSPNIGFTPRNSR